MIYVSKEQLHQVEYLIKQSIRGHHVLFDTETVRRVFKKSQIRCNDTGDHDDQTQIIEQHIEKLILQPTLLQKRAYLEKLSPNVYAKVVRTYFNIVENNLYENEEVRH